MKIFQKTILTTLAAAALIGGSVLVEASPAPHHRGAGLQRLTAQLGLSADQQQQAKTVFQNARTSAQPVRQQLKQERQAVTAAIQAGKPADQVQTLAQSEGPQLAQLAGIHAGAMAQFNALLTPDQQQKLASMRAARHGAQTPAPTQQQ